MFYAAVPLWQIEGTTKRLWGAPVEAAVVCRLAEIVRGRIHRWRERRLDGEYGYVFCAEAKFEPGALNGCVGSSVLLAVGVNAAGCREVLGVRSAGDAGTSWDAFLGSLRERGLSGVQLLIGPRDLNFEAAAARELPEAGLQQCIWDFYGAVLAEVPKDSAAGVLSMLKAIHASEDREAACEKAAQVARKLNQAQRFKAAAIVSQDAGKTLAYYGFPGRHWAHLRTLMPLTRLFLGMRQRHRVLGTYGDKASAVLLVSAWLRHVAGTTWRRPRIGSAARMTDEDSFAPEVSVLSGFAPPERDGERQEMCRAVRVVR